MQESMPLSCSFTKACKTIRYNNRGMKPRLCPTSALRSTIHIANSPCTRPKPRGVCVDGCGDIQYLCTQRVVVRNLLNGYWFSHKPRPVPIQLSTGCESRVSEPTPGGTHRYYATTGWDALVYPKHADAHFLENTRIETPPKSEDSNSPDSNWVVPLYMLKIANTSSQIEICRFPRLREIFVKKSQKKTYLQLPIC